MKRFALIALMLLLTPLAWAQNQHELNVQAGEDFKKADAELNQVYKKLTARLPANVKKKLVDAQLVWIKYRDANAEARAAEFEGGSMAPMIYAGTRTYTTKQRTQELRQWLKEYANR